MLFFLEREVIKVCQEVVCLVAIGCVELGEVHVVVVESPLDDVTNRHIFLDGCILHVLQQSQCTDYRELYDVGRCCPVAVERFGLHISVPHNDSLPIYLLCQRHVSAIHLGTHYFVDNAQVGHHKAQITRACPHWYECVVVVVFLGFKWIGSTRQFYD